MTREQIIQLFPRASEEFINANSTTRLRPVPNGIARQTPVLECAARNDPLEKAPVQKAVGQRFLVRVTSFRKRLLDEDNLAEKYHVDLLRYAGILPQDTPGICKIEVSQQKSKKEFTRIEVMQL